MKKIKLADGNSYGCSLSATGVLLQLDDSADGEQVRVELTKEQALDIGEELLRAACAGDWMFPPND